MISGSANRARNCRRKAADVSAVYWSLTSIVSTSPVSKQTAE